MADYDENNELLDWDSEIAEESSFTTLPAGDYGFRVVDFAKAYHSGSEKVPPCNMAQLTLEVYASDGSKTRVNSRLYLTKRLEWMLSAFFRSIGQKKHGEPLRPNWNAVLGATGKVRLKQKPGTKNPSVMFNEVDRFLDPDPEEAQAKAPTVQAGGGWKAGGF